jgi:multidrug efflux system membrane fusion protein
MPVVIVAVVALAGLGAWLLWGKDDPTSGKDKDKAATAQKGGKGGGGKGGRFGGGAGGVQPVAVAAARIGEISIVQTGLGTATALRTVTVKPRVDGQLQGVSFTEGAMVKAGESIAHIDPVPFQVQLAQAEGQLARDAAMLNNARLDLERYRTLLAQDSIAQQQVDQQAAQVKQLEGTVKIDQAQVDNAKLQLSYTNITAPIGGRLGLRQVDPGNMVHGSDPNGIAVITQVDPITVVFTIPQDVLPRVLTRLATGDKPAVEAWDRENKISLATGTLITTDNQIDVTTGTVKLKAQFANPAGKLFPNQFVNVRMVVDVRRNVVVVPAAAVQRANQGTVVYVVKEDSTVSVRPVTAGPTEGTLIAIESGLQAGERVITDGVDRIREGSKVEVTEPGAGSRGGGRDPSKRMENMTPEQREAFKKRLESMTPEQREAFKKQREAQGSKREETPPTTTAAPTAPKQPPAPGPNPPGKAPPTESRTTPADAPPGGSDWKKRREDMTPEEREAFKKRLESMTPEEREALRKRREERMKAAQ